MKDYVNCITFDGKSALMWAVWAGLLNTVKLLARNRADSLVSNRNGCTVAHWAASGGSLDVCRYLADVLHVDFTTPIHGGSKYKCICLYLQRVKATTSFLCDCLLTSDTPLTHAVAFERADVVRWLLKLQSDIDNEDADEMYKEAALYLRPSMSMAACSICVVGADQEQRSD